MAGAGMTGLVLLLCVCLLPHCTAIDAATEKKALDPKELKSNADLALMKRDYKTALANYNKLVLLTPDQLTYHKRATIHAKLHQYKEALSDLRHSVDKDPKFEKGYMTMGDYQTRIGQCEEALESYKKVVEIKPKRAKKVDPKLPAVMECASHVKLAHSAFESRKWDEVKSHVEEALKIAYESTELMLFRCRVDIAEQDYQSALVDTREVLLKDKANLDALSLRGEAFYWLGEHDAATTHYREGLRLDPEHKSLKKNYKQLRKLTKASENGEKELTAKRYPEAIEFFQTAITVDPSNRPNNIKLHLRIVDSYLAAEDGENAVLSANRVMALDGNEIEAWMKRAEGRLLQEEWQEAINDYTKATQINNGHRPAQEGLQKAKLQLKMSLRKDYYKILGVTKKATEKEIKKAFRKLALEWHPDKHKGEEAKEVAEKKFQEIGEAAEILGDEETRGRYDRGEDIKPQGGGQQRHPFHNMQQGGQKFHFNFGH